MKSTIVPSSNIETVRALYDSFQRQEMPALSFLAPDVEWEYAWESSPMPWLQPGRGPDHVVKFFGALQENLEFTSFTVNHILEGEDLVVVLVSLECIVKSTGKRLIETDEPHVWHFNKEGLCVRFRHAANTLRQYEALQP